MLPAALIRLVRARAPLVHVLTNPVAAALSANALLAVGAVPAMVEDADEAAAFRPDAVLANLGSLTPGRATAIRVAVEAAMLAGRPWVLDPVAAGSIPARREFACGLLASCPCIVRANASEVLALAEGVGTGRGPESTAPAAAALAAMRAFARASGAVVAMTGAVDHVTDGAAMHLIPGGTALMARISGLGCTLSAVAAACAAVAPRLPAAIAACTLFARAGERAMAHAAGPASLAVALVDALADPDLLGPA